MERFSSMRSAAEYNARYNGEVEARDPAWSDEDYDAYIKSIKKYALPPLTDEMLKKIDDYIANLDEEC